MNRHLLLPALLAGALAACTSAADTQTITGRIQSTGFSGAVLGARAVSGDTVVATSNVDSSGGFSLDIPKGSGYRLEIVTSAGAQPLVAGTSGGSFVAMSFDVCAPVAPFDLGDVFQGDSWPGDGTHDGGCGCPDPDPNGNCPPPPCDPTTDPSCQPPPPPPTCPNPNPDGTCPPPCDPTTDPNCLPPPPPPCDPSTDPNCAPCPNPNPDGTCPPPCDPTTDPSCLPPPPCDPTTDPSCQPPPPCDPSTDPNCAPCPNPAPDGTCPPPCDPTTDPNCQPPPPPPCDDPSTCPPPPGQPCDADGNCDPGQCAVPAQPLPSFGCGGV